MRPPYGVIAFAIGLVGFAAIETGGVLLGQMTAITRSVWIDAAAYGIGTLLLGLAFAPLFRRMAGVRVAGAVVLFLLLYAPLVAAIAGVMELTIAGTWSVPGLVRGAFIAGPVNLIATFLLELPIVALPLGIVAALALWWRARRTLATAAAPLASTR